MFVLTALVFAVIAMVANAVAVAALIDLKIQLCFIFFPEQSYPHPKPIHELDDFHEILVKNG